MAEIKVRLNLDAQDIEVLVNDKVIDTVGSDLLASWVEAINEKNGVGTEPVKAEDKEEAPTDVVDENKEE